MVYRYYGVFTVVCCLLTIDCCLLNYQKNLQVCFDLPVILRV